MKTNIRYTGLALMTLVGGAMLTGCASDNPFDGNGEGVLRMNMVINADVTRAESDIDDLRSGCVVYISGPEGLMHKYVGLENVPDAIHMTTGHYVAEAWTGDSVPASFSSKFFRGYQPFDVARGENRVVVNCRIQNTIVSVNNATINPELMKDWTITVTNAGQSLTFDETNVATEKAYFMLASTTTELTYEIKGTDMKGDTFTKTGSIADPKRTHEYILNLAYNPVYEEEGGAFITVTIDDREVIVRDELAIYGAPAIKGADFDIDRQITGDAGAFSEKVVKISGFNGLRNVEISTDDAADMRLPQSRFDLRNLTGAAEEAIRATGLDWDYEINDKGIAVSYLHLTRGFLNALPQRDTEYCLNIAATDVQGKTSVASVRIAVGEGAVIIEDPVTVDAIDGSDLMAVGSRHATLTAVLADESVVNPGIEYRESGATDWTFVPVAMTRAKGIPMTVRLTGLKPGTRYEYRPAADGFSGQSQWLTTETEFTIPNASMEEWSAFSENSKVLLPGAGGTRTFWDSGNHGSATMSVTLTQGDETMKHSGARGARLRSQFVGLGGFAGKFAAGNLFAGTYLETQGTDGRLEFGRPYDGSHPSALSVWVNYRPGKCEKKGDYLQVGDLDKGQIYVALSTEPVEVRTKASTRKLFSKDDECIVAYGQYTFDSDFAADGQLERLTIPLDYYAKAKTTKPLYLIIVCSASYYGDYFNGGEGSVMYVDDFNLEYE